MKLRRMVLTAAVGLVSIVGWPSAQATSAWAHPGFRLTSTDLKRGAPIPEEFVFNSFGCNGENISPQLQWTTPPAEAKSLAVIVHDPDARTGVGGFTHWIVYNIPAAAKELTTGAGTADGAALPVGSVQSATSFGAPGWGGPCPPAGERPHRYQFTVYALSVDKLELPAGASQAFVGFNIVSNSIASSTFTARYGR
jgi:Raf kinase inhibitor-like YbhB/YbcL family protein